MERIAKGLARDAQREVVAVEKRAFGADAVPAGAVGISIGFDRTSAPMAEELPEGARKPAPKRRQAYSRAVPAPMSVNWRMAYIGTVCVVDEHGEALETYRYAATAADDPRELTARMGWQVATLVGRAPELHVGIVQDGAPEMWTLMRDVLQPLMDRGLIQTWHEAIDLPHLMGRLGEAFKAALSCEASTIEYWKRELVESDEAIDTIEAILRRNLPVLSGEQAEIPQEHLTYIENNKDRMRYAGLRSVGLPIGSGVTESTAKNVVNMRAKRSGQRWSVAGLRGVLNLRALLKSARLGRFWEVFSRRYVANVNSLSAAA